MMSIGHSILRKLKMGWLHQTMSEVMGPLYGYGSMSFEISESGRRKWDCFPVKMSYCSDIPEGKNMSSVNHCVAVRASRI